MTAEEFIEHKKAKYKLNKKIRVKDIGRKGWHIWEQKACTMIPQSNLAEKVFIIERMERVATEGQITHSKMARMGDVEYRIGYYIIGKIGKAKGRWIWGQFCPLIPAGDLNMLLTLAKKEGVILKH